MYVLIGRAAMEKAGAGSLCVLAANNTRGMDITMNAIAVVDENWAIGKDGGLLVHLPGDLKYYKKRTLGHVIVVGRKTLESFPGGRPLPGRTNIVLTANPQFEAEGCIVCRSKAEVLAKLQEFEDQEVFIAGGATVYQQFLDDCDDFYVTKIDASFDADRYFPNLDEMGYQVTWESPVQEENGIAYRFLKYIRP